MLLLMLTLCWSANPDPSVNLYKLYLNGSMVASTSNTRTTIEVNAARVNTFTVTALAGALESDPSAPLTFFAPAMKMIGPGEFTYTRPVSKANQTFSVQSSSDLVNWTDEGAPVEDVIGTAGETETVHVLVPGMSPVLFYRIKVGFVQEGCAA